MTQHGRKAILVMMLVLSIMLASTAALAEGTLADSVPHPLALAGIMLNTDKGAIDLSQRSALFLDAAGDKQALSVFTQIYQQKQPYLVALGNLQEVEAELAQANIHAPLYTCQGAPPIDSYMVPALVSVKDGHLGIILSQQLDGALADLSYPLLIGEAELPNSITADPSENNAACAAAAINGAIVQPGQTFSFLNTVGIPSASRGYQMSRSMIATPAGPGWVPDIGGGVCISATILNLAVEQAGLTVIERHHHSFPVSFVPPGQDTAVDHGSDWDYRFINSQNRFIKITASCINNTLEFQIWEI